ncbi:MAG: CPBP family intramembrane metalloprotease [Candidatus Dormibacteraeota bacterium]|nr:CPBP family intramembrane metalloprotease [Candidatus Dormibacteraeota bacterium]MBV9525513.1 CPBP family intramembrane metalloprotease [Candidatus Dormibacteraeota bacterium]
MIDVGRVSRARWWPATAALVLGTAALGAALLVPLAFSDPNGVDPYVIRLSVTALLLLGAAWLWARAAGVRALLLALVAITSSFTVLSAAPQVLVAVFGDRVASGDAQVLWASLAQLVVTAMLLLAGARFLPPAERPVLRLWRFGWAALAVSVGGSLLLVLAGLALPASLLGRYGLQPVALIRDMPWLGPANALQALSQEAQFRGMLMGGLERVMGRNWANLGQAVFFGLAHLAVNYQGPVAPFVPVTIAVGLVLGWIVQRTGSIWPAVIIHAVADIAITAVVLPGLYGF